MKKITFAIILIILLSFIIGIYSYYNIKEDKIISHWNIKGQVDGYMPKFWGIFLIPLISLGVYLIFLLIPKIDPNLLILILILFLFYIFILIILSNFKYKLNINTMLMPAIGILFFCIGIIMKKLKRNWFIGIRTPWTLSSDKVWKKTHHLGSLLFKFTGVILFFGIFFSPEYFLLFILIPIFVLSIWLVLYSYLEYKKLGTQN